MINIVFYLYSLVIRLQLDMYFFNHLRQKKLLSSCLTSIPKRCIHLVFERNLIGNMGSLLIFRDFFFGYGMRRKIAYTVVYHFSLSFGWFHCWVDRRNQIFIGVQFIIAYYIYLIGSLVMNLCFWTSRSFVLFFHEFC